MVLPILIILYTLHSFAQTQSQLQWHIPQQVQLGTISIVLTTPLTQNTKLINQTFQTHFSQTPTVLLSLTKLQELKNDLLLFQTTQTISKTNFVHKTQCVDPADNIKKLSVNYLAINLHLFNFVYPHVSIIEAENLKTDLNTKMEFIQIQYLKPLEPENSYTIEAFMTGFQMNCEGPCSLGLAAEHYNQDAYLLKMTAGSGYMIRIQFTRILIDKGLESASEPQGLNQIGTHMGSIAHYQNQESTYPQELNAFYPQSFFFGIKQFDTSFDLVALSSVFIIPEPRPQMKIFYLAAKQKKCHSSQPYYNQDDSKCYQVCEIQLYKKSQNECGLCHNSCYKCSGPEDTDCTVCLSEFGRVTDEATNKCVCLSNLIETSSGRCQQCDQIHYACQSCTNDTHCVTCKSGCAKNAEDQCYCEGSCEPYEFKYISPHTGDCLCKQQYFLNASTDKCEPCDEGCFICQGTSSNCFECVNGYYLVDNQCLFFIVSENFISKFAGYVKQNQQCLTKISGLCVSLCQPPKMIFQQKCYDLKCPTGKFLLVDPYNNAFCHPCKGPCIECQVYYKCDICKQDFFYRSDTGQCLNCKDNCYRCKDGATCDICLPGFRYDNSTHQCSLDTGIQFEIFSCQQGCLECVIEDYCQICNNGYFLREQTYQCIACQNNQTKGLILDTAFINETGYLVQHCKQICGDGLIFNQDCDDKNNEGGDGCSSNCQIQDGYICEYSDTYSQSICYKPDLQMIFNITKNLTNNQLQVFVWGIGISTNVTPLDIKCASSFNLISNQASELRDQKGRSFIIDMESSMHDIQCQVYASDLLGFPNASQILQTAPQALYFQIQEYSLDKTINDIFGSIHKAISIFLWIIMLLGIDPYEIWAMLYFNILFLVTLYDYQHSIPNIYGFYEGLQFMVLRYGDQSDNLKFALQNSYKIMVLFAIIVLYNELLVRLFKNVQLFPVTQVAIFQRIFSHRFTTYYAIITAFQPILILNVYTITTGYFSNSTENPQFSTDEIIALIILSLLGLILIASYVFLVIQARQIIIYRTNSKENKQHHKFIYLLPSCKFLNLVLALALIYNNTHQIMVSWGTMLNMGIWLILVIIEDDPEVLQAPMEILSAQNEELQGELSQISDSNYDDTNNPPELQIQEPSGVASSKLYLRKTALFIRLISIIGILICRMIYFADYNYSVDQEATYEQIGGTYYHQSYKLLGIITSTIFMVGIYSFPLLLTIILHILIIYDFVQTDTDAISQKVQQQIIKQQKKDQMQKIEEEMGEEIRENSSHHHLHLQEAQSQIQKH